MFRFSGATIWMCRQEQGPVAVRKECGLLLYTEGRVFVDFGRKRKLLNSKQLLYVQPEAEILLSTAGGPGAEVTGLCFQSYSLEEESGGRLVYRLDYSMLPNSGFVLKPIAPRVPSLVQELVRQSRCTTPDEYSCVRSLNELIRFITLQMNKAATVRSSAEQAVTETIREMLDHCEWSWTREQAARSKQFHVSHFSRAFQMTSGYSFSALLSAIRLNQARLLLLSTDLTLDRIAHRAGFMNGLYLSRRFKQEFGISPTGFRTSLQNRPLRLATMHQAGHLMALGITPVAASLAPWHTSPLLHRTLLDAGTAANYELEDTEALRALKPDLILIPGHLLVQNASRLRLLEEIAPVLILSPFREDTLSGLELLAVILDKLEEAKRWRSRYEAASGYWRKRLNAVIRPGETAALYELRGENQIIIWFRGNRSAYNLRHALGAEPPAIFRGMDESCGYMTISLEELPRYAADHMFIISELGQQPQQFYSILTQDGVWRNLPALRHMRLYPLPLYDFWSDDASALEAQLPVIVETAERVKMWAEASPELDNDRTL